MSQRKNDSTPQPISISILLSIDKYLGYSAKTRRMSMAGGSVSAILKRQLLGRIRNKYPRPEKNQPWLVAHGQLSLVVVVVLVVVTTCRLMTRYGGTP